MENLFHDIIKHEYSNDTYLMKPVYICFCNTKEGLGNHYDKPRFVFTQCHCPECALIYLNTPRTMLWPRDNSTPVFEVLLTSLNIDYIFNSADDKELHAKIVSPQMIEAFTRCAMEYGSPESMSWYNIVATYNYLFPQNNFSACYLENYFLQLACLVTYSFLTTNNLTTNNQEF